MMTESERILNKHPVFTADFLKEETRCEYFCSQKLKKVQLVLLDLVLELDRVSAEKGLQYMLVGGSMLGAVRHQGFIPWDDDMDVAMPRTDYEKLKALSGCFAEPYFLQLPGKDGGYFYSYIRLRNSNTTACTPVFAYQTMNQGLALDIFPLDDWIPEEGKPLYDRIMALNRDNSSFMRRSNPQLSEADRARADSWSGRDPQDNLAEIEALARHFEGRKADYLSHAVITVDAYPNNYFHKSYFEKIIRVPFEGVPLPVPAGYDAFLRAEYGDYMTLPPVEKRGDKHAEFGLEPDVPYREYLKSLGIEENQP